MQEQEEFTYKQTEYRGHRNNFKITCRNIDHVSVGYVWFEIRPKKLVLRYISVKPKYRNKHIGSTLLQKMETFAKENGIYYVEGTYYPDSSDDARAFYEKNGYTVPNQTHTWDNYDNRWALNKSLSPTTNHKITFSNEKIK